MGNFNLSYRKSRQARSMITRLRCVMLQLFVAWAVEIVTDEGPADPDASCTVCTAMVDQVYEQMKSRSQTWTESMLYDITSDLCNLKNFRTYDLIPPKMSKGCYEVIDALDDFEAMLWQKHQAGSSFETVQHQVCSLFCDSKSPRRKRRDRKKRKRRKRKDL